MSSPDLTIPDLEDSTQEEVEDEVSSDQKRMKMIQLAEDGEIS